MPLSPRNLLQYNDLLELFPAPVRRDLYNKSTPRTYQSGESVFRVGEGPPYFMAVVMSGRLRMTVHSLEGKEMLITMIERGEIFGEMSVLDNQPRAVDVTAETESLLYILKQEDFLPLLFSYPEVMFGMLKATCHRMRLYIHTMELIALQQLPARLARYLLRLARDYGTRDGNRITIHAGLNQVGMGQQVAATRESINKQLKAFEAEGLINVQGDTIIIHDVEVFKVAIKPASNDE